MSKINHRFRNSTIHLQFVTIYRDLLFLTDPPKVGQHQINSCLLVCACVCLQLTKLLINHQHFLQPD